LAVNRKPTTTGTPGWVRLGELLQDRRRRELDPQYYSRSAFAAATGVNLRYVQEIERNKRENFTPLELRDKISKAYQVTYASVRAVIDGIPGADLEAAPGSPPRKPRGLRPVPVSAGALAREAENAGLLEMAPHMKARSRAHILAIAALAADALTRNPGAGPIPSGEQVFGDTFEGRRWDMLARLLREQPEDFTLGELIQAAAAARVRDEEQRESPGTAAARSARS
jgi:transcriptional regulator with XRE-family HTH domain